MYMSKLRRERESTCVLQGEALSGLSKRNRKKYNENVKKRTEKTTAYNVG